MSHIPPENEEKIKERTGADVYEQDKREHEFESPLGDKGGWPDSPLDNRVNYGETIRRE